jgi:hypothetical protein
MKITYSIWQGSLQKGTLTASKMSEVVDTINELNESGLTPKFEAFIHKLEGVNN